MNQFESFTYHLEYAVTSQCGCINLFSLFNERPIEKDFWAGEWLKIMPVKFAVPFLTYFWTFWNVIFNTRTLKLTAEKLALNFHLEVKKIIFKKYLFSTYQMSSNKNIFCDTFFGHPELEIRKRIWQLHFFYIFQVFMINLVRRPDRRIKMELSFKELGMDYKYFPAVDGRWVWCIHRHRCTNQECWECFKYR